MKTFVSILSATMLLYVATSAQTNFIKYRGSPVLRVGAGQSWDYPGVSTGGFLVDDSLCRMWYKGWTSLWKGIGYATSPDGVHWTKHPANPMFSGLDIWPSSVVRDSGSYHMYYGDHPITIVWNNLHSTSPDGITWTPDAANNPLALLGTPDEWDDIAADPRVVIRQDSVWKMWYTGFHNDGTSRIGYATSTDLIHWTKPSFFPVLGGSATGWDAGSVYVCDLMYEGSEYRMWYCSSYQIGYATSVDGRSWTKFAGNPVYWEQPGEDPDDQGTFAGGCRIVQKGGVYKMWYDQVPNAGTGETLSQIGLAVDSDSGYVMAHPYQVSFGEAALGASSDTASVCLMNYGRHPVRILSLKFSLPAFELLNPPSLPLTLAPMERDTLLMRLNHTTGGLVTDILRIVSTSAADTVFEVYVSGTITGVREPSAGVPREFGLDQNYPNPFNPTTTIQYTIGGVVALSGAHLSGVEGRAYTNVRLAVYDILGREVATLVNERKAAGSYTVTFNASGLPSGMYICRMTARGVDAPNAEAFFRAKKMILLK